MYGQCCYTVTLLVVMEYGFYSKYSGTETSSVHLTAKAVVEDDWSQCN